MPTETATVPSRPGRFSYGSSPIVYVRRLIETSPAFDPESRSHALGWGKKFVAECNGSASQQAVAAYAFAEHALWARDIRGALLMKPTDKGYATAHAQAIQHAEKSVKHQRTSGLTGKHKKGHRKQDEDTIFSPPRAKSPTEIRAEQLEPDEE